MSFSNHIRQILNDNMDDNLWHRHKIYEMIRRVWNGEPDHNALADSPGRLSLPSNWRNRVYATLKYEVGKGTIFFDEEHYQKIEEIPNR